MLIIIISSFIQNISICPKHKHMEFTLTFFFVFFSGMNYFRNTIKYPREYNLTQKAKTRTTDFKYVSTIKIFIFYYVSMLYKTIVL